MFHEKHEKTDNTTIFMIGIPQFISLSQALRAINISDKGWKQFVNFYFDYTQKDIIDIELIQILNYCSLASKGVYLDILARFNGLKIIGNMNKEKSYRHFLKKYLGALSSLGYSNTSELWKLDMPEEIALEVSYIEDAMRHIREDISGMQDRIGLEEIQVELGTIIAFMDKNIVIAKSEHTLKPHEPGVNTQVTSRYIHQEEFDRLAELQRTVGNENFMKELEKSYKNELISAYEVDKLLK